jgi:hypothetical protein
MSFDVLQNFNEKLFILNLSSDLQTLSSILSSEHNICISTAGINQIASKLKSSKEFEYELSPLEFKFIDYPKHLSHTNIDNLRLKFSIKLKGDGKKIPNYEDPLNSLEFNIWIFGTNKNNPSSELFYSLHFDRHIEGENPSKEIHPIYHFQFGGRKIDDNATDRGQALFMDVPRIMYHPMDIILGIDFLLSNFFPKVWEKFKKNGTYNNIMQKYQSYFVYPYFKTITKHFEESITQPWKTKDIYPQLVEVKY